MTYSSAPVPRAVSSEAASVQPGLPPEEAEAARARLGQKLIPLSDPHRLDHDRVRSEIWGLYAELNAYQRHPDPAQAPALEARFDALFTQRPSVETLNQTHKWLYAPKHELLRVLERSDFPLHTNGSEGDIRGVVKWRKIGGGTRSDLRERCRDTFASQKNDLPETRRLVLGLSVGSDRTAGCDYAVAGYCP